MRLVESMELHAPVLFCMLHFGSLPPVPPPTRLPLLVPTAAPHGSSAETHARRTGMAAAPPAAPSPPLWCMVSAAQQHAVGSACGLRACGNSNRLCQQLVGRGPFACRPWPAAATAATTIATAAVFATATGKARSATTRAAAAALGRCTVCRRTPSVNCE